MKEPILDKYPFNFYIHIISLFSFSFLFMSQEPSSADNLQDIHIVANNMISELASLSKTDLTV